MQKLVDVSADPVFDVLNVLLKDKTTGKNVVWATDAYASRGPGFGPEDQITKDAFIGDDPVLIQPRIKKGAQEQQARTKKKAEVYTPSWLCNKMNNYCDAEWFGRPNVFNEENGGGAWTARKEPIWFNQKKGRKTQEWQKYVDSRRLESTCGEAPFLVSRYDAATGDILPIDQRIGILDRKLRVVNENTASETEWLKWAQRAVESCYGYEYQGDSLLIARINVLMTFYDYYAERWKKLPEKRLFKKIANIVAWNIWQMDGLNDAPPFAKKAPKKNTEPLFEGLEDYVPEETTETNIKKTSMIKKWRSKKSRPFGELKEVPIMKNKNKMFDFVIGNPPYQEDYVGSNNQAKPVYNLFMDNTYRIASTVVLITPARFLTQAGATPKEWNKKMLNDEHFKILHYEEESSSIFSGVEIKGGVVISYHDSIKTFEPIEVFVKSNDLRLIFDKVKKHLTFNIGDLVHSPDSYRFKDVLFEENPQLIGRTDKQHAKAVASSVFDRYPEIFHEEYSVGDVKVVGRKRNERITLYAKGDYFNDQGNLHKWKVLIAGAIGSGAYGESLSELLVLEQESVHTQTFVSMGEFTTKFEAESLVKYVKTKFARSLLGIMKTTQNNQSKITWSKIPLQDFTSESDIDWSKSIVEIDQQLYRKYGLSEEEIEFIETHVKEMN